MEEHFLMPQSKFEELRSTLLDIKTLLIEIKHKPIPLHDWVPESEAQKLLGLKETSMWSLRKRRMLVYSKVGGRIFYSKKSIEKLIDNNSQ